MGAAASCDCACPAPRCSPQRSWCGPSSPTPRLACVLFPQELVEAKAAADKAKQQAAADASAAASRLAAKEKELADEKERAGAAAKEAAKEAAAQLAAKEKAREAAPGSSPRLPCVSLATRCVEPHSGGGITTQGTYADTTLTAFGCMETQEVAAAKQSAQVAASTVAAKEKELASKEQASKAANDELKRLQSMVDFLQKELEATKTSLQARVAGFEPSRSDSVP